MSDPVEDDRAEQQRVPRDREQIGQVERDAVMRAREDERIGHALRPREQRDEIPDAPPQAMPAPHAAAFDGTRGTNTTSAVITAAMISAMNGVRA